MCGRFALSPKTSQIEHLVPGLKVTKEIKPRYNIAPTQNISCVLNDGRLEVSSLRWGLIPSWAKDPSIGSRMINSRAETILEKPSFRTAFRKRRCLILADGFYEWKKISPTKKIPQFIRMKDAGPFTFGGIWEQWIDPNGEIIRTASIITTMPNELMSSIHDRMPLIIPGNDRMLWLSREETPPVQLIDLLRPYPADEMEAYEVSTLVNNPGNDLPECRTRVMN